MALLNVANKFLQKAQGTSEEEHPLEVYSNLSSASNFITKSLEMDDLSEERRKMATQKKIEIEKQKFILMDSISANSQKLLNDDEDAQGFHLEKCNAQLSDVVGHEAVKDYIVKLVEGVRAHPHHTEKCTEFVPKTFLFYGPPGY
jgi:SpoVK/Ycf46/Vps4 family AAA+-type ATPase